MYHVPLVVQCKYAWSDEGGEDGDGKESGIPGGWERMEIAWPLYAYNLVLCGES